MDSYLERLRRELEEIMTSASPARMSDGPEGKWSSAQVLEHLFLTYRGTNAGIAKCLEKGAPLVTKISMYHRVGALLVVELGYLPKGRKSPEPAVPKGMAADEVRRSILPELDRMDAGLEECARKFGSGTRILDHPVLGPFSVAQWRKFHWVHGRHHARQIRERLSGT